MISYDILDIKLFTEALFDGDLFDNFLMTEARIDTYNTFSIDGRIKKGYYTEEEALHLEKYSRWKRIRPVCFLLIKGRRLPVAFHIVLKLTQEDMEKWFSKKDIRNPNISGLYLNIRYEERKLSCVSACSLCDFSTDNTAQKAWDEHVGRFLKNHGIAVGA